MGIEVFQEEVLGFPEAAKRLPRHVNGKNVSVSTFYRWAQAGLRGEDGHRYRLETVRLGGRTCTSAEALQRFFNRLSGDQPVQLPESRLSKKQLLKHRQAEEELRKAGI